MEAVSVSVKKVLLQFGDSRKVFDMKEPDDMNEVISKIKSMFAINASSDLFLQEYEEEWNDWVDVEDVDHIKDRAKLRVHVRVDQAAVKEKHAVSFILKFIKFERVWTLRENHVVDRSLPQKYVFFLACCYQPGCIHPVCREKSKESEPLWYPGGPHLRYVPIPTPDPDRPYGGQCQDCEGVCSGHYLKPDKLWQHANSGGELGKPQPPSDVIFSVYREHKSVPSEAVIQQVARSVLLSCEEVKFWFDHLHQTHESRRKGAQKAAQTRREKAQGQSNRGKSSRKQNRKTNKGKQRQTSSNVGDENDNDENVLCVLCELHDPLQSARDDMVSWVQCDGCLSWCHISCAELEEDNVPGRWLCLRCSEVWYSNELIDSFPLLQIFCKEGLCCSS